MAETGREGGLMNRPPRIVHCSDTTLRDGGQMPGAALDHGAKLRIAKVPAEACPDKRAASLPVATRPLHTSAWRAGSSSRCPEGNPAAVPFFFIFQHRVR